jgi:serine/threonine protein kinase
MSPEQARDSRRSDVWAFGALLYEMLVGQRPFDGATVSDTLAQVLEREPDVTRLPPTPQVRSDSSSGDVLPRIARNGCSTLAMPESKSPRR